MILMCTFHVINFEASNLGKLLKQKIANRILEENNSFEKFERNLFDPKKSPPQLPMLAVEKFGSG